MIRSATVLAMSLVLVACEAFTDPEPPGHDQDALTASMRQDAALLALRELEREQDMDRHPVRIDPALVRSLEAALHAVDALQDPNADSATDRYPIHVHGGASGDGRQVLVTSEVDDERFVAWRSGLTHTGRASLDSITEAYEIDVREHHRLDGIGWDMFVLESTHPLNTLAVARRLQAAPGVVIAERNGWGGDGNDIVAEREDGAWILSYWLQWGDCPSGCIYGHYWRFRVSDAGVAAFVTSGGETVPDGWDYGL